jgi:dTDP-4-dehydrorhamnose reductase
MKRMIWIVALMANIIQAETILIFGGKTGWIGQKIVQLFNAQGHTVLYAESRLENREQLIKEIEEKNPDAIINAAGIVGKPNVDWCEDHKQETIRVNVLGNLNLIDIAFLRNIHVTNISTGCIYEYDAKHQMRSGNGFTEEEEPNFDGSFYSSTKILIEKLILNYPNVLNLRMKMPIDADTKHGFLKIVNYKKVVNIPNSLCVLDDMLPIAVDMTLKRVKGNFNFVNPGTMSHPDLLELYKEIVNPDQVIEVFTQQEHDAILKARRANAELNPTKLLTLYPDIPDVKESVKRMLQRMRKQ